MTDNQTCLRVIHRLLTPVDNLWGVFCLLPVDKWLKIQVYRHYLLITVY